KGLNKERLRRPGQCKPHPFAILTNGIRERVFTVLWRYTLPCIVARHPSKIFSAERRLFRHGKVTLPFVRTHILEDIFAVIPEILITWRRPEGHAVRPVFFPKSHANFMRRNLLEPEHNNVPMRPALGRSILP